MKLPNAEHAYIDMEKLLDYSLSTTHREGKHKARVFASALGITADNADELRAALLEAAQIVDSVPGKLDEYGQRYIIDFIMVGPNGPVTIRSAWNVRTTEDFPRLVTCYIL